MRRIVIIFSVVAFVGLIILWIGCSGGGQEEPVPPDPRPLTSAKPTGIPDWFLVIPDDPNYFYANATASAARDVGLALSSAKDAGREDIAAQIATKVSGMFKRFSEEVGIGEDAELTAQTTIVSKSVVSEVIRGCRPVKQAIRQEGFTYHAYVQMRMPVEMINTAVVNTVKADKQMYTQFRASQAFKELEAELQKREASDNNG